MRRGVITNQDRTAGVKKEVSQRREVALLSSSLYLCTKLCVSGTSQSFQHHKNKRYTQAAEAPWISEGGGNEAARLQKAAGRQRMHQVRGAN